MAYGLAAVEFCAAVAVPDAHSASRTRVVPRPGMTSARR